MSVVSALRTHASDFELIQAVRVLRMSAAQGQLYFALSALPKANMSQIQHVATQGSAITVEVVLEALGGAKSVLPDYFYQQLLTSLHQDDSALLDFLNIFNHRYTQLYLAQRERNHLLLRDEQERLQGRELTRFSQRRALQSLSGLSEHNSALLPYSLLLGQKSNHLPTLQRLLADYFELNIQVRAQLHSHHLLPRSMLSQLSARGELNNRLGRGVCLGKRCTLQAKSIEICVAVSSREEYLRIQGDVHFSAALKRVAQHYLREPTPIKLLLQVRRRFLSEPQLLSNSRQALRLGESNCLAPQRKRDAIHQILLQ
ncbi:MAG: type VI secretion system baseplate subunit TssG [Pseudomonadales bacterium]